MTTPLTIRELGSLRVSALGFGAMVLSPGMYGEIDDTRAVATLRHAFDTGVTFGFQLPDGAERTGSRWARRSVNSR